MLEAYARGVNAWIAAARPVQRARVPVPRHARAMGAGGQPALGRDDGPVAVAQLAHRAVAPVAGRPRCRSRRSTSSGRRRQAPAGPKQALRRPGAQPISPASSPRVLPRFPAPYTLPDTASNEWAVDGRHTATGAPLLAGDPHLAFGFPGIWYLARIETPDGVLAGATAPGRAVPGPRPQRPHRLDLHHHRRRRAGRVHRDAGRRRQIPDAGRPASVHRARGAHQGPRRARPDADRAGNPPRPGDQRPAPSASGPMLAVAMANLAPATPPPPGCSRSTRRSDVAAAGKAAAMITSPVQNLLVADRQRIALYVTGRVPIRRAGDGSAPVPGDGSHDWIGWASGDQLPHIVAPAERAAGQCQRPHRAAGFPGIPRPRLVRRLARPAHPRAARPVGPPHRRPISPACRWTCIPAFARAGPADAARRAAHRGHRPPRPGRCCTTGTAR